MILKTNQALHEIVKKERSSDSVMVLNLENLYGKERTIFKTSMVVKEVIQQFRWINKLSEGMQSKKRLDSKILYMVLQCVDEENTLSFTDAITYFNQLREYENLKDYLTPWCSDLPYIPCETNMALLGIDLSILEKSKLYDRDIARDEVVNFYLDIQDPIYGTGNITDFVKSAKTKVEGFINDHMSGWKVK